MRLPFATMVSALTVLIAPGGTEAVPVSDLSAGTYVFHGTFEHGSGAFSPVSSSSEFTILHAPAFASPSVTGTDATVSIMNPGTDPCTLHYVVLDSSSAVPDVSFIRAHASVDTVLIAAGATEDVSVSDLSAGTYVFYGFFAHSSGADSSVSSSPTFTVGSVSHAPSFATPSVTGTDATVSVTNPGTDPCTLHYVVLDSSSAVPDVSFIRAHASVDTVLIAAGATEDVSVSGLSAGTYVFHGFFEYSSGVVSSVSSSSEFTILHAPSFASPSVTGTDVTVSVMNPGANPCTLHYVVLDSSSAVPDVSFIRAHASVDTVLIAVGATEDVSVSGLSADTYVFYGFFAHSSGADSSVSSSPTFTVGSVSHAPSFATPSVTGTDATVSVMNPGTDPCTLHYVVLDSSAAVPDVSFIRAHASVDTVLIAAGATEDVSVSDLSAGTYVFHGFFEYSSGVVSSVSSSSEFTILHAPAFASPSVTGTDVTVSVTNPGADPYTLYYIILDSSSAVPDVSFIRAHASVDTVLIAVGATEDVSVSGLSADTYVFYGFFAHSSGADSSVSSSPTFTVGSVSHAPSFATPSVTGTDATVSVTNPGTDPCTLHYVVLDSSSAVPDVSFIRAHASVDTVLIAAGATEDVSVSGLSAGTYVFHGFFEYSSGVVSSVSSSSEFTILHAPAFASPSVTGTDVTVSVTNPGADPYTLYYIILDSSSAVPDEPSIRVHSSVGTVLIAAGATEDVSVSGLSAGTYVFHGFFAHSSGAVSSVSSSPTFTVLHAPAFASPSVTGTDVTVSVTNPGADPYTLYYIILDSSSAVPDEPSIRAHASVATVLIAAGATEDVSVSGLSAGTYVFHGFFAHSSGAVSSVSSSPTFTVLHAPAFASPSVTGTDVTVSVTNPGAGTYTLYYIVLDSSSAVPDVSFIRAHASVGTVLIAAGATEDVSVSGLSAGTYVFHGFFDHLPGAFSSVSSSSAFTIVDSVSHVPAFASPSVTGTDVTVSVTNPGADAYTLYYIVLDSSSAVPDVSFIRAHASVDTVLIAPGATEDVSVSGLSAGTYVFYGFFAHSSGADSSVSSSSAFTIVDSVSNAPVFATPSVTGTDVTVSVTNPGVDSRALYYVVLDSSAAAPDEPSIRAHSSVSTLLIGPGATEEASASGLSNGTYVFYGFFEHSSGAVSSVSNSDSFAIVSLVPPSIASVTPDVTSASVRVQNNNSSALRVYWVALLARAPAPTTTAAIESATALNGNVSVAGNATQNVSILGLTPNTAYTFYAFFKSTTSSGASSGIISSTPFTTLKEPPFFGFGIPSVSLSPNPVEDVLVVESSSVGVLLLYTLSGTVLDSHDVAVGENDFSFTDYPSGIYVVRLIFAGREVSYRIVKQ